MLSCLDLPEPCAPLVSALKPALPDAPCHAPHAGRDFNELNTRSRTLEDRMARIVRLVGAGIVLAALSIAAATAQQLDPKVVTFKLPDRIVWKDNPRGGNRSAVLQGDPSKPGPYAMLLQWLPGHMSRTSTPTTAASS
jgi:hypothetical protein